jgi:hypothetical protein
MPRTQRSALTADLVDRFSQRDLARHAGVALPFVTVDEGGRPHPMLISYLELRAHDTRTVGLVIQAQSGSARHLVARGAGTLIVVEADVIAYVKLRLVDGPLDVPGAEDQGLGYFLLGVEEVIEDSAAEWEGGTRVTDTIRYAPIAPLDSPWARATVAALAAPRARA